MENGETDSGNTGRFRKQILEKMVSPQEWRPNLLFKNFNMYCHENYNVLKKLNRQNGWKIR